MTDDPFDLLRPVFYNPIRVGVVGSDPDRLYRAEWSMYYEGQIFLTSFRITKRTACGAWIDHPWEDKRRFVNLKAVKQYASETEAEAIKQLLHRTERFAEIHEAKARKARNDLAAFGAAFLNFKRRKP